MTPEEGPNDGAMFWLVAMMLLIALLFLLLA